VSVVSVLQGLVVPRDVRNRLGGIMAVRGADKTNNLKHFRCGNHRKAA